MFHVKHPRHRALLVTTVAAFALFAAACVQIATPEGWPAPALAPDGTVVVHTSGGELVAVDPDSGREVWRFPDDLPATQAERIREAEIESIYATPLVNGSTVYAITYGGLTVRIDVDNGRIESPWSTALGERVVATPLIDGDRLYIATERGHVAVLDAGNGDLIARHRASAGRIWGQPVLDGDVLYLADLDERRTVALNIATGERLWEQGLTAASAADLVLDDRLLIVGSFDRALHALDVQANGDERWRFRGDGWFVGPPAIHGDVRYAASMGGSVYAIDRDGEEIWRQRFEEEQFRASPIVVNGVLVVASRDGLIAGLDPETGTVLWDRREEDARINAHGRLIESSIFFVTTDHELLRIDPETGGVQRYTVAG